jgi:hypothetical protein
LAPNRRSHCLKHIVTSDEMVKERSPGVQAHKPAQAPGAHLVDLVEPKHVVQVLGHYRSDIPQEQVKWAAAKQRLCKPGCGLDE